MTENTATVTTLPSAATRLTWKQHGRPTAGFEFFGTEVKTPATTSKAVAKVVVEGTTITLKSANGRALMGGSFATTTKFWAVVPEDAPRKVDEPTTPKEKTAPAAPVVITAPKGGTQTVPPIKGAIAKAVADSGSNIMAISRTHGLNPAQMRRLSLDQVAKVDLVRAEAIAKALGKKLADLFGEASDKAKATPKAAPADTEAAPATEDAKADEAAEGTEGTEPKAPEGDQAPAAE
jgi:ribosomal protein L12E/L44/L45/RPP1/RPP2